MIKKNILLLRVDKSRDRLSSYDKYKDELLTKEEALNLIKKYF